MPQYFPGYRIDRVDRPDSPVLWLAPHGSIVIPDWARPAFPRSDDELKTELDRMTDHFTDELAWAAARHTDSNLILHGLSRLVVDVERFDDDREEMSAVGMGVLYSNDSQGRMLRELSATDAATLMRYYYAYSSAVEAFVSASVVAHGRALIVDVHSYPRLPLPYEPHRGRRRPGLCIGTSGANTSPGLLDSVREEFAWLERGIDEPFAGSYVPQAYLGDPRVQSVMLEIRRDVYCDEATLDLDRPAFDRLVESAAAVARRFRRREDDEDDEDR